MRAFGVAKRIGNWMILGVLFLGAMMGSHGLPHTDLLSDPSDSATRCQRSAPASDTAPEPSVFCVLQCHDEHEEAILAAPRQALGPLPQGLVAPAPAFAPARHPDPDEHPPE